MAFDNADAAVTETVTHEERVVCVELCRTERGAGLDVRVWAECNGRRKLRRLTDADADALWQASAVRSFRNWIMNVVIPNAR